MSEHLPDWFPLRVSKNYKDHYDKIFRREEDNEPNTTSDKDTELVPNQPGQCREDS